ncbi:FtsX-like permease family protein [Parabacteroides sp. ZJ-118]|uniref:FtsX-like permease family protein n=1 Tax=Parabacteroides sp. ZJ-118 TaxID=2709398 RepID=UPI0013ECDDA0|nr:FtsX-like permease family protein [Parabacteroides sp. ZJ-118]
MKSYFTFLRRNKFYTAIQFFGMAIALGVVVLLTSYAETEFNIGNRPPYSRQLYAIGNGTSIGMTLGTAPELFPSIPEIKEWTRLVNNEKTDLTIGDHYYQTNCLAVDSNFFRLLGYPLIGDHRDKILIGTDEAVLSEPFARKVFGNEDPIGRTVMYKNRTPLRVVGILPAFDPTELLKPVDVVVPIKLEEKDLSWMDGFGSVHTFVTLAEGATPETVARKLLDSYKSYWDYWEEDNRSNSFAWGSSLTRMDEIYFSPLNSYTPFRSGTREQVRLLLAIAMILLVSAVFNYINLTVSQAGKRAHEMATRRLMGDSAGQIILRYLAESAIFTTGCFIGGCLIAIITKPYFEYLLSTRMAFSPSPATFIYALLLLTGISGVSGLLPALIISKYRPIDIVKGNFRLQNKQLFSRMFIIVQNVISTVLITLGLIWAAQIHHLATLPTGYNTDLAFIKAWDLGPTYDKQVILQKRLQALPQVVEVALARKLPFISGHDGVHQPDEEGMSWLHLSDMDSVAFRMFGFQVVQRWSDPLPNMIWVTEETCRRYQLSSDRPHFGKKDDKGGYRYNVCGVIRDYRSLMPLNTPIPDAHGAVGVTDPKGYVSHQVVRTQGDRSEALSAIRRTCREVANELIGMPKELEVEYIDDYLDKNLTHEKNTVMLVLCFMTISILISALGLLAMSISYTEQQSKRIALCKVMGAEPSGAVWELSKRFMTLSLLAACIALPFSLKAVQVSLEPFYNRIAFPWHLIAAAVLATIAIAFLSIIGQTLRVARRNPIESIRTE